MTFLMEKMCEISKACAYRYMGLTLWSIVMFMLFALDLLAKVISAIMWYDYNLKHY
jgi:hypothetical protein